MTTRRVLITPGAGSPLRVAAGGVDASGASFEDLIFDANQPPLRVFLNGWMRVAYTPPGDANILRWSVGPALPATPSGTYPLFLTMFYQPISSGSTTTVGYTPYGSSPCYSSNFGAGGAVGDGSFTGINFMKQFLLFGDPFPAFSDQTHISYCIFRNYQ
ncbi:MULTISPECIES: hypothetical protein [unclassified Bradyrhizobium]|uniref:hypothetical protein n=1 Tax=unclassified Bradyrhizobium TaxID=2631580 RepID=UPI00211E3B06|nr:MULTISPECIES: hypothetical protein [unclassified Bradyrhizobium]MDD1534552.1 hypothetical protein [Bradyrhizobium sp. WBOS8]MDD1581416.1 hypothetical protein [Bradyrhizobium sp. WBOS4]UUO49706.1 hypothetical protein DCM78_24025 [Bradyrhizobium sp. WBOS04]UUO58471.1 hypothetical protein DCM80_04300 [Bradyrhizobium sp. WBOS08]